MKFYNKPSINVLTLSPTDIIQNSPAQLLMGNDPFIGEPEGWVNSQS